MFYDAPQDITAPQLELSVHPDLLWPPKNKMVLIIPSWTVTDNADSAPGSVALGAFSNARVI